MRNYRCPVCKKPLSKKEYESALGIIEAQKKHLKDELERLAQNQATLRRERVELKAKAKKAKQEGLEEGKKKEKERAERLFEGKNKQIKNLQQRIQQLQKGTTPQTEGLEFEDKLVKRLQREYPYDEIKHEGKGGDVLHFVIFEKKRAGVIIYECKRTPHISTEHVRQAFRAKQTREADFAILVTTGQRKGFTGLDQERGVLLIAPLGVVPLVSLLREHLIEMLKSTLSQKERAIVGELLLKYVASPQFKNPIEEIITRTSELESMVREEASQHFNIWQKRWESYQRIKWDSTQIRGNLQLVLHGEEPKPLVYPKAEPLQLLPPSKVD